LDGALFGTTYPLLRRNSDVRTVICMTFSFALVLGHHGNALGVHIPESLDVAGLRTSLGPNEGYLSFHFTYQPYGEERTGWTDVRHPALDGTPDPVYGFDRSDFNVNISTKTVTDGAGTSATPNIVRDFEYASAVYAQAGISVVQTDAQTLTNADYLTIDNTAELAKVFGTQRQAGTVNAYYVQDFAGGQIGQALSPEDGPNNGFAVADGGANDTFAHELGHFLVDSYRYPPGNQIHNPASNELMAAGGGRNKPTNLDQVGRPNGNMGGRDQMATLVHQPATPATELRQERVFNETPNVNNPTVSHIDNGLTHGDMADFDWVEDNLYLEQAGGRADNHDGYDWLVWQIGPIAPSSHSGHDHGNWGVLDLPAFTGDYFGVVDVVSQIAWWTDMDVDESGNWSLRDSALDYTLQFSDDGQQWVQGMVNTVFIDGWTNASKAEDWVARWISPVEAEYVRISELIVDGHDGNTQIDAVIARQSVIPESSSLVIWGCLAGLALAAARLRRASNRGRRPPSERQS